MRWRVFVVKKPVTAWPETRSFSSHGITQSFQNFNVIFFVDRLTSWSKFVVHNTLKIEKNNQHWLGMNFFDLFFLSFSTVNKCHERKKHVGHKHTLRATQGVRPVTTSFREFVRDYWLRSYPAEANRMLWREDINAGRILFGQTSYSVDKHFVGLIVYCVH